MDIAFLHADLWPVEYPIDIGFTFKNRQRLRAFQGTERLLISKVGKFGACFVDVQMNFMYFR
jgi:hypothetical protein